MITDISKLVGKVITNAQFLDWRDRLALVLSDGEVCIIEWRDNYGDNEIQLSDSMTEGEKFTLGIITDTEYNTYLLSIKKKEKRQRKQDDIAEYNRLKEKLGL